MIYMKVKKKKHFQNKIMISGVFVPLEIFIYFLRLCDLRFIIYNINQASLFKHCFHNIVDISCKLLITARGSRERFRTDFALTCHNSPAIISASSTHSCYISCCSAFLSCFSRPPAAETNVFLKQQRRGRPEKQNKSNACNVIET